MMKLKSCRIVVVVFFMIVTYIALKKYDDIYHWVDGMICEYTERKNYNWRHENIEKIGELSSLEDDEDEWYNKYHIISHSGGGIDGKYLSNSYEAWLKSYSSGNRVFDADLRFTTDGELVLRHDWNDDLGQSIDSPMSVVDFTAEKIYGEYTPMTFLDAIEFIEEYPDCYIACDAKCDPKDTYLYIYNLCKGRDNPEELLNRIIVTFYRVEDYDIINNIYNFSNWEIRQTRAIEYNYAWLAKYCVEHGIKVVMLESYFLDEGDSIEILNTNGIRCYIGVVDSKDDAVTYIEKGVNGFVSNELTEEDYMNILTKQN